jgi:DNA repair exonuclease SbcCD ATPase subunit
MIEYAVHTEFQQWYDQNRKQECEAQQPSDLKMLHSPTKSRSKSTKVLAEGEQLLQNLREEIEKLKQERDMAQEALISANNQIEQLEMQLAATLANKSDIEKERDDDHTLRKDLENILAEERQRRKDAEDERDQLRQLLSLSEKSMDELRQHLRERSEEELSIPSCDLRLTNVKLGGGSYGEVRIAYWKECPVAVKMLYEVLTTSKHNIDLLMQEASVAWKIHHPNVASVCGVTLEMESKQTKAWIIMELLQASMTAVINESLRSESQALTLREKVDMAHDSLSGLNYLHSLVSESSG